MKNVKAFSCITLVAAVLLLSPGAPHAAELSQGEKDTIFIGGLQVQPSVIEAAEKQGSVLELKRVFNSLDTQFINALSSTRVFQLVERKRKGDIELEQDFSSVAVDPNDKNAAKAGRMAGAKFAFLPQIDGFEDSSKTVEYKAVGRAGLDRKVFLSATVQVVDTTTGKLLPDAPSVQLTKEEVIASARPDFVTGSDRTLVELAKEVARRLSNELVALLRPAKILAVTGKQIMFNRGSEAGFNRGETVEIFAVQDVKDEETGETYRNEVSVGQATIQRLDKRQSFAVIVGENLGITKGCIVKPAGGEESAKESDAADDNQYETPGSSEKPAKW